MLVQDLMSRDVFTLAPDQALAEALEEFAQRRIRRAPVVERDRVVGFISERSIRAWLPAQRGGLGADATRAQVREVMNRAIISVRPTAHLEEAIGLMFEKKIGGVPVIDGKRKLVGILTESDLFLALWRILGAGQGARVAISEAPHEVAAVSDLAGLARHHGCALHSLVRYPRPDGGFETVLRVSGGDLDGLIDAVWRLGDRVIEVERADPAPV